MTNEQAHRDIMTLVAVTARLALALALVASIAGAVAILAGSRDVAWPLYIASIVAAAVWLAASLVRLGIRLAQNRA